MLTTSPSDPEDSNDQTPVASPWRLTIKFPWDGFHYTITPATEEHFALLPRMCEQHASTGVLRITLKEGAHVQVDRYGIPFSDPDPKVNSWVNDNKPLFDDFTLLSLLQQRSFGIVTVHTVSAMKNMWRPELLPAPLVYPYGDKHDWDPEGAKAILAENKVKTAFDVAES